MRLRAVLAVALALVGSALIVLPTVDAGAATYRDVTIRGHEFVMTDAALLLAEQGESRGGVIPIINNGVNRDVERVPALEARLEVPVGARITEVSLYYCGPADLFSFELGYYTPAAGTYTTLVTPTKSKAAPTCTPPLRGSIVGRPITTAVAGNVYVIRLLYAGFGNGRASNTAVTGARLKYSCPTSC